MKKLVLILIFTVFVISAGAQGLFKPVPKNLFTGDRALNSSTWLMRLNAGVVGTSYAKNKETGNVEVIPLNALGFGISYLHYKDVEGSPFNDFGFNALLLQNTQTPGMGVGVYGTYNTGPIGLLNVGGHYDLNSKRFMVDVGITFHY